MSQVNVSATHLPWANSGATSQGYDTGPSTSGASSTADLMTSIVSDALSLVLRDPAKAQSYIASGSASPTDQTRAAGTAAGTQSTGSTSGGNQSAVLSNAAAGQQYHLPWGGSVSGADLVQTQKHVGPFVGPVLRAAGAVIGGGPQSTSSTHSATMSTQATVFVQTLAALDPATIGQAQVTQLTALWNQVPGAERPDLRSQLTQGVIAPTIAKIEQVAGARPHPGTAATAGQQQAQAAVAGLNAVSALIAN